MAVEGLEWLAGEARWRATLRDRVANRVFTLTARTVINATGPDTDLLNERVGVATEHRHVLSKGIHLIVDRVTPVRKVLLSLPVTAGCSLSFPWDPKPVSAPPIPPWMTPRWRHRRRPGFCPGQRQQPPRFAQDLTPEDVIAERVGVRPLAVAGDTAGRDWVQLSRKHQIEVDRERAFVSVFGGKLTDCLNVGDELVSVIASLGVAIPKPDVRWFGEDGLVAAPSS